MERSDTIQPYLTGCEVGAARVWARRARYRATPWPRSLDRLARSTRHLLETMETIREVGARFQSLSELWADTTTHAGKMIMTVFAGIAEFERNLILERTQAGRIAAKTRGVRFGRGRPSLISNSLSWRNAGCGLP